MATATQISASFPFASKYVEVHGSKMHYIEEGSGDPILFLHGNPTSCYLWRNVIPHLSLQGRCIAPDLIGMGQSDKPDIGYRFVDHVKYIEGFIEEMGLKNITLVIHDWGSALGFNYAMKHPDNIRGIAFMEGIVRPSKWSEFPPDFKMGFKLMRTPGVGWFMISVMNMFIKVLLPQAVARELTDQEKDHYASPYPTIASRKPVRQWPVEIPIDGQPSDVHNLVSSYSQKLQESQIPKLLFHATPGGIINPTLLQWCIDNLPNLKTVDIGRGVHYLQEDNPDLIGQEIAAWHATL